MRTAIACVAASLLAHSAHAEPPDEDRSEVTAGALAVVGSLVGPATIAIGVRDGNAAGSPLHDAIWPMMAAGGAAMILGPSLGNWYAGQGNSLGLDLRIGGALAMGVGFGIAAQGFSFGEGGNGGEFVAGGLIGLAGLGMLATGTVLDVINAPRAAHRHHRVEMTIAPLASAKQTGVAVAGTF